MEIFFLWNVLLKNVFQIDIIVLKLIQHHGNAEISIINLRDQTSNEKNNYRSNVLNNVKNITIIYRSNFESNSKKNDHQLMYLQLKKY